MAYGIYRTKVKASLFAVETIEEQQAVWDKVIAENIFVICKTPMAKSITKRTLAGFRKAKVNTRYFEDKEAEWFFKQLLEIEKFDSKSSYGYDLTLVSAKLGCDNLRTLYTIDD